MNQCRNNSYSDDEKKEFKCVVPFRKTKFANGAHFQLLTNQKQRREPIFGVQQVINP